MKGRQAARRLLRGMLGVFFGVEVTAEFADLCDSDDQINPSIVAILKRFTGSPVARP